MFEIVLQEILKTIRLLVTQPLLYWVIFLILVSSYERVERERINFGYKIFDQYVEWRETLLFSIVFGLLLSTIMLGVGFVFSYETIYLINIIIIMLSITCRYTLLSPSYTLGLTYLMMLLLPSVLTYQSFLPKNLFSHNNFTGIVILLGLLLLGEAFLLSRTKRNKTLPNLVKSKRGIWIGQHHLRKIAVLPLLFLVPYGAIEPFFPDWPYLNIGSSSYSVMMIPFVIGFDHPIKGNMPEQAAKQLSRSIGFLGIVVLLIAIGSYYIPMLSIISVILAIIGREYIVYKLRMQNENNVPYFTSLNQGLKVLSIIPNTPADRLNILVGEIIIRVNDQQIKTIDDYYKALQDRGAFFKLEVLDDAGEVRFIQSAFYEDDHYKLGIIFTQNRHRDQRKEPKQVG